MRSDWWVGNPGKEASVEALTMNRETVRAQRPELRMESTKLRNKKHKNLRPKLWASECKSITIFWEKLCLQIYPHCFWSNSIFWSMVDWKERGGCPILSWQSTLRSQAKPFGSKPPAARKPSPVDRLLSSDLPGPVGELWWWGCLWSSPAGWRWSPLMITSEMITSDQLVDDGTCPQHPSPRLRWNLSYQLSVCRRFYHFDQREIYMIKRGGGASDAIIQNSKIIGLEVKFLKRCVQLYKYMISGGWLTKGWTEWQRGKSMYVRPCDKNGIRIMCYYYQERVTGVW